MTESSEDPMADLDKALPAWFSLMRETHDTSPMFDHFARQGFPTVAQLRRGILLGCIANALYLTTSEGHWSGIQWEGDTYLEDNEQGERWAAAFTSQGAVAVFHSSESDRNPWSQGRLLYDQARYFRGMPDTLRPAKERALSWMINFDYGLGGPDAPITAAMWADGEQFTANEPWEAVFYNSLWACRKQLCPFSVALIEWQDEFDLNDEGVAVLRSLYQRRLASAEATIPVEPWECETIMRGRQVSTPATLRDDPGLLAARDALASVGIALGIEE